VPAKLPSATVNVSFVAQGSVITLLTIDDPVNTKGVGVGVGVALGETLPVPPEALQPTMLMPSAAAARKPKRAFRIREP
jgi:hypothetical protein